MTRRPTIQWFIRATALALALSACSTAATPAATPAPAPQAASKAAIRLEETMCYFRCAAYDIEVRPDGSYKLNNRENTPKPGASDGKFAPDVWAKAQAALDAAKFDALPDKLIGATLAGKTYCMNDLPDIHFTRVSTTGAEKTVIWNTGCGLQDMATLRDTLRGLFQYTTLVKPAN